ncbi:hypothetical protein ACJO2E_02580 [Marinobacter sp. M1N3S26]|uniref:hypothetical protein n=1 Tax=Marinobacter sp. M1N3S26 TaxID=3382299 RepID=UPI00387B1CAF
MTTLQKIKALEESGLSFTAMAKESGIPQPTIWRIARGKHSQPLERTALAIDALYQKRLGSELSDKPVKAA